MIIYGWRNFNRREHRQVRTGCQKCGVRGHLHSYVSTRFLTLYFIPIIPLGKQRILAECPACGEAYGISYGRWKRLKRKDLAKAVTAYETDPLSEDCADAVLELIYSTQDEVVLRRVGSQIRTAFPKNEEVLSRLASVYSYLCLDLEADEIYLEAVTASEGKETSSEVSADAEAHMMLSKHEVLSPPNRLLQSIPVLIVPAVLLFFLGTFLQDALSSKPDHAYLVNGLNAPYEVLVNGQPLTLKANRQTWTSLLKYGENEVVPTIGGKVRAPLTVEINNSWLERSGGGSVVLVNPDKAAVVLWESSGYSYPVANEKNYKYEVNTGKPVYVFDHVDYLFREFPDEVQVPEGRTVFKDRVGLMNDYSAVELAAWFYGEALFEELSQFLEAKCQAGEDFDSLSSYVRMFVPEERLLPLVDERLTDRPVEIEWHRIHQDMHKLDSYGALVQEYRSLVEREKGDGALLYLLGRILDDPTESRIAFERSALAENPSGYACNALSYHYLLEGDFDKASKYGNRAKTLNTVNPQFRYMDRLALYGLKDFEGVRSLLDRELDELGNSYSLFKEQVFCLEKLGLKANAKALVDEHLWELGKANPEALSLTSSDLEATLAIADSDKSRLAAALETQENLWSQVFANIMAGDLAEASELAHSNESELTGTDFLVLYVLCSRASLDRLAEKNLGFALDALKKSGGRDQAKWAGWLSGEVAPTAADAAHTCFELESHYVYMLALSKVHRVDGRSFAESARRMKFQDSYYSMALDDLL